MYNFFKDILLVLLKTLLPIIIFMSLLFLFFNYNFEFDPRIMYIFFIILFFIISLALPIIRKNIKNNYKNNVIEEDMPYEFRKIYAELFNNHIITLEKMRKKIRWRTVVQFIAFALFFIGYIFGGSQFVIISESFDLLLSIIAILAFLVILIFSYTNYKYIKKYKSTYKNEIISNFIKLLNDKLIYKPKFNTSSQVEKDYKEANFENRNFNRFYQDDYIEGNLNNDVYLKMIDIHIQNVTGSGKNRHTEEIFQGIFGHTKCNKNINTYIKISRNKIKLFDSKTRLEMDSEEFEKYFDIYSEDKILAMRLLTADTMEYLVNFYKKYELDFEFVFKDDKIYLRFFTGPMFEPKIFGSSMDKELLFVYYKILEFILELTKKINKTLQEIEI